MAVLKFRVSGLSRAMAEQIRRITLEQARKLKSLSNARKSEEMSDEEIDRLIASDPDLYQLTDQELAQFQLVTRRERG